MRVEVVPNKKLWDMAKLITEKQKAVLTVISPKNIDWNELVGDWFDWLDEEINGTDEKQ